jgi:hypothetical protein
VNIASEQMHSSLAQRIAKVRNCMLVELSTGVPATDKDLFASLCQTYEQNSVLTSCAASASPQNTLDRAFALSDLTPESVLLHRLAVMSGKDISLRQQRVGFSIVRWHNLADDDDSWTDWDKR